jgi:hypothetical protein
MPSSVPAALRGLRTYLASWPGLRESDGVQVRSAPDVGPLSDDAVEFGDVVAPQRKIGLTSKEETPTITCWTQATVDSTDEDAKDLARLNAYGLLALVEEALAADQTAAGTIARPAGATVGTSTLVQTPADAPGGGTRRAQVRFTISWTSHI